MNQSTDITADAQPFGSHVLPLLAEPDDYVACQWDLRDMHEQRDYWLGLFRGHFPTLLEEAVAEAVDRGQDRADAEQRAAACRAAFEALLDDYARDPGCAGRLDIISICIDRERVLRAGRFDDPYRLAKARENAAALAVLPALLAELDALDDQAHALRLIEGVFAGNIFDLGATQTAELFRKESVDFHATRSRLAPRPWLIDDLDRWLERWRESRPYNCALMFVDNAGCDVVLGMIPLARALLQRGSRVILTSNPMPSLNDITHAELATIIHDIAAWDEPIAEALDDGRLLLVPSGNGLPLIDLRRVSPELVRAVHDHGPDLVVLEGMGRGVESNLYVPFRCDVVKIAMLKDEGVAAALGGGLYDLVFRFEPA